jgi:hypothetical protein
LMPLESDIGISAATRIARGAGKDSLAASRSGI